MSYYSGDLSTARIACLPTGRQSPSPFWGFWGGEANQIVEQNIVFGGREARVLWGFRKGELS